jgi:hypothetical protein
MPSVERRFALPPAAVLDAVAATASGFLLAGSAASGEGDRSVFVLKGATDDGETAQLDRLPPLPAAAGAATEERLREQPVLLIDGGTLAGIAWLEGPTRQALEVRAARWDGRAWQRVEKVSSKAPGGQIALTGAVLDDGSWLLAWTRFDGEDDESVFSWRRAGEWSEPQRVGADNRVPDIVPALSAVPGGALLAWSRYDGNDYRLMTARFEAGDWSEPRWSGPAGSMFPSFTALRGSAATQEASGLTVLYRTAAAPGGWTLAELDTAGTPLRQAKVASPGTARPSVASEAEGIRFSWPGRKKASAFAPWDELTGDGEVQR